MSSSYPTKYPLILLALSSLSSAFTFSILAPPTQCGNFTAQWTGGTPPYELLLVPLGHVTPEIRTIVDAQNISGTSYSVGALAFPTSSTFVAVLSDSTGVGTGGTSEVYIVGNGPSSCLDPNPTTPEFFFYLSPEVPSMCEPLEITWDTKAVEPVSLWGIIPGGNAWDLKPPSFGTMFSWIVNVNNFEEMILVMGDKNGRGKGGSTDLLTVRTGNAGCINNLSPSSTPAPAAGQVVSSSSAGPSSTAVSGSGAGTVSGDPGAATGSGGSGQQHTQFSSSSHSHTAAIAEGVIGGIAAFVLLFLLLFWCRRRRQRNRGPVFMAHGSSNQSSFGARGDGYESDGEGNMVAVVPQYRRSTFRRGSGGRGGMTQHGNDSEGSGILPRFYQPEPFVIPNTPPSTHGHSQRPSTTTLESSNDHGDLFSSADHYTSPTSPLPSFLTPGLDPFGRIIPSPAEKPGPVPPPSSTQRVRYVQHEDLGRRVGTPDIQDIPPAYPGARTQEEGL